MVRNILFKYGLIVFLLPLANLLSQAQTYQFETYGENEGLPHNIIYTVNQDHSGFIWLGTGKGLCRFDGFDYYMSYVSDSLEASFPVSSYETGNGIIYFGFNDGTVHYTSGSELIQVPGIEGVRVNDIVASKDSLIFVISQSKGIFMIDPDEPAATVHISNPLEEFLYCADFTPDGNMILGSQNGIALCSLNDNELELIDKSEDLVYYKVQDIEQSVNPQLYYVATEGNGMYAANFSEDMINLSRAAEEDLFTRSRIQAIKAGAPGTIWISTFGNGLVKAKTDSISADILSFEVLDVNSGLPDNNINTSYVDDWGNTWIAHFGSGVSVLRTEAYKFYSPGNTSIENNIIDVSEFRGNAFAGTVSGYYLFDFKKEEFIGFTDLSRSLNRAVISDYYISDEGLLLVGTEGQGVYKINSRGQAEIFYRSDNNLENYVSDILGEAGKIWIGTRGGVIVIDKDAGSIRKFTTSEKLPHNNINHLTPGGNGNVLVATEANRLYFINPDEGVIAGKAIIHGGLSNVFQSFATGKRDKIWGATKGSGIYCFENDSVWNINGGSGLLSDFCYSLLCDSKNNIWVGHQKGISFYNQELDVIRTFTDIFSSGADCNNNAIYETTEGYILIGTTEGFMVYDPGKDKSKIHPPRTNFLSLSVNDRETPLKDVYNLPYSSRHKIEINYVGLNYSDPDRVYYRYSMENYDTEWSDPTYLRNVTYRLGPGSYRFNVLAYTYDGISDNQIKSFQINIKKPFWETWWFLSGIFILLMIIVTVIIKIRERAQARVKKFLEDELAERTKEVVYQKEEIEYQNREITDSINYAQRIQASLLPPVSRLSDIFKGAFVFYRPRDIVSGDFYWFDMISDDKIIIVCADSTGHGVPGAFMSMIGSALLQEIVNRKEITRPSEILRTLDLEITTTLNQTGDDTSNDGMDMVVCEFNPKTRLMRFASALRPVILVMDGEQYYIRGNKNSIGGEFIEEKFFDDQEYYLKEDDAMYIFSDGYPDQFGGPDGKKLKIVRLKRLIDEISDLSMSEQSKRVSDYFDEWKADIEQVDDVLLMGIKV